MAESNRRRQAATESIGFLAITAGILVLANVLVAMAPAIRLDCTGNELFSLSDGSRRLAGDLTDELVVDAYFTEDLPPPFHDTRRYVADILAEYEAASGGKMTINFINPDTDDEREAAEEAGIVEVEHAAIQEGSTNIVRGYRGLVMRYLDQSEVIPVIQDTSGLEYEITMKIKKMVGERVPIGVLGGHEGPTLGEGLSKLRNCLPTYELREVQATDEIDEEIAALLIVEPQTPITEEELRRIDQYVMRGGSLGVFGGSMRIELTGAEPQATASDTGLNRLLRRYGVFMKEGIVHDAQCGRAPLRTQIGMIPVPHPPVPIVSFDEAQAEHPVTFRLSSAPVPFTAALDLTEAAEDNDDWTVTTLMNSSDDSWLVTGPVIGLRPRPPREWPQSGAPGPFPITVAIEGRLRSAFAAAENMSEGEESEGGSDIEAPEQAADDVHVLVSGGSFFMRDEALPEQPPNQECQLSSHLAFALNAVDWLANDSDLIAVRAKNVEEPQIEVPQDVRQAEDEARDAATDADEARTKALTAAAQGDEDTANEAVGEHEDARGRREEALEEREAALAKWETTKNFYRWGNMLGIPFAFALFGLIRWQMRVNRKKAVSV